MQADGSVTRFATSGLPSGCLGWSVVIARPGHEHRLEEVALRLVRVVIRCERPPQRKVQLSRGEPVVALVWDKVDVTTEPLYDLHCWQAEDVDVAVPDHVVLVRTPYLDRIGPVPRQPNSEAHTDPKSAREVHGQLTVGGRR